MIAASQPMQRPPDAKLLVVDQYGRMTHTARRELGRFLREGDLVVANDAATLPASLQGTHLLTGNPIEVRLAARRSLAFDDLEFSAIVFGAGDFRIPTEDRPAPPRLATGDRLQLGPIKAAIVSLLGHPRLVSLRLDGPPDTVWAGIARHGRPIQYSYMAVPLELWDVWSPIAGAPVAFEAPSAGFALDWRMLAEMRARGTRFATITHAAGISSTGDAELDGLLPFDEPYRIPKSTALEIELAQARGGRVIAIGTTVVRALEHAVGQDGRLRTGDGTATQRLGRASRLKIVDAILSGTHEPHTSHYELIRAFVDDETLRRATLELEARNYRTHEFGDSVLIERKSPGCVGRSER